MDEQKLEQLWNAAKAAQCVDWPSIERLSSTASWAFIAAASPDTFLELIRELRVQAKMIDMHAGGEPLAQLAALNRRRPNGEIEDSGVICDTANNARTRTPENAANAKLIAAAPELQAQLAAKDAVIAGLVGAARKAYTAMSANDPFSLTVWTEGVDALEAALALAADATKEGR